MKKILSLLLTSAILVGILVPLSSPVLAESESAMPELKNGVYLIKTYEQLRNLAAVSFNGANAKLVQDVKSTSNENDYMIQVQANGYMSLDLNGYTLSRSAYSLDECLISVEYNASFSIYDSSKEQTGTCFFEAKAPIEMASVILNNGGQLTIENGNYILKTEETQSVCGVIAGDSGYTYIKGGYFDGCQANAGVGIKGNHWGYVYESPVFIVSGGKFYGKGGISLAPYGNYIKYGSFFPTVFLLGGEFHLLNPDKGNGFAYCNNGWGDIFIGGGTFPAYSLNGAREYTFGDGCVKELVNLENPAGIKSAYYQVTPAGMIVDSVTQPDVQEILLQRLMRHWLNKYKNKTSLVENNSDLFDALKTPRIIYVDRTKEHPFEMQAKNVAVDCTYRWLIADSYGENAQWTHVSQYDNNILWVNRPEEAATKYYRLEVTPAKGEPYTDDVMIIFEASAKTTVLGEIAFYINQPEDVATPQKDIYISPLTIGGYEVKSITWKDTTENKTLSANQTFIAGHKYEAQITLKALEGFAFSKLPPVYVLCNGKACKVETTETNAPVSTITVTYDAGTCPTTVSSANLTICPPVAGCERDLYPQIGKQNFTVNSVTWFDTTENREMNKGELFVNGHHYAVEVWLEIDDGFTFANDGKDSQVKGTVNGNHAPVTTAFEQSLDEMIVVNYDFGLCDSIIDQVNVVDVCEPFPGENPIAFAWSTSQQYAVASIYWYGPDGQLFDSDTFMEGVTYEVAIQLLPLKYNTQYLYTFDENARGYINKTPANRVEISGNSLIMYAQFLCTVPQESEKDPEPDPTTVVYGDVNRDSKIDAKDALEVLKFTVEKTSFSDEQKVIAEVIGDTKIDAKDALEILKFTVNKIDKFPIELK